MSGKDPYDYVVEWGLNVPRNAFQKAWLWYDLGCKVTARDFDASYGFDQDANQGIDAMMIKMRGPWEWFSDHPRARPYLEEFHRIAQTDDPSCHIDFRSTPFAERCSRFTRAPESIMAEASFDPTLFPDTFLENLGLVDLETYLKMGLVCKHFYCRRPSYAEFFKARAKIAADPSNDAAIQAMFSVVVFEYRSKLIPAPIPITMPHIPTKIMVSDQPLSDRPEPVGSGREQGRVDMAYYSDTSSLYTGPGPKYSFLYKWEPIPREINPGNQTVEDFYPGWGKTSGALDTIDTIVVPDVPYFHLPSYKKLGMTPDHFTNPGDFLRLLVDAIYSIMASEDPFWSWSSEVADQSHTPRMTPTTDEEKETYLREHISPRHLLLHLNFQITPEHFTWLIDHTKVKLMSVCHAGGMRKFYFRCVDVFVEF